MLSLRRSLKMDQTLTATHDTTAAWAGLGSATVLAWNQKAVPASIVGVFLVFLYLGSISVLHITIPALFSIQAFTTSRSVPAITQSLPSFNFSGFNLSNEADRWGAWLNTVFSVDGSLYFMPSVLGSTVAVGVRDGSLYDVPEPNAGQGNITVNATGFNISCGYLKDVETKWMPEQGRWSISVHGLDAGSIRTTQPGVIATAFPLSEYPVNYTLLYSTISIVDSRGTIGSVVDLSPPMNTSVSSIQLLRCSQSLVSQKAVIDAQSLQLMTVTPSIAKTVSAWSPATLNEQDLKSPAEMLAKPDTLLINSWQALHAMMPKSEIPLAFGSQYSDPSFFSVADVSLIQKLNLLSHGITLRNITLHDVQNALSAIVAGMFWTVGHIHPPPGYEGIDIPVDFYPSYVPIQLHEPSNSPILLQGAAMVNEISTQVRVDLSIIAVAAGLVVSIALTLLSLPSSMLTEHRKHETEITIGGIGALHAIWLYRNHPELETLLQQVEHPTDHNLRAAGMVRIRLLGTGIGRKSCESF
ncbi:hypothetical protein C8J57DRAFT_1727238 [Mycena rebaudengoi]|nr:hypothetical protein C8J57DRAFT_1727238 [Mycena rebaudengoi]